MAAPLVVAAGVAGKGVAAAARVTAQVSAQVASHAARASKGVATAAARRTLHIRSAVTRPARRGALVQAAARLSHGRAATAMPKPLRRLPRRSLDSLAQDRARLRTLGILAEQAKGRAGAVGRSLFHKDQAAAAMRAMPRPRLASLTRSLEQAGPSPAVKDLESMAKGTLGDGGQAPTFITINNGGTVNNAGGSNTNNPPAKDDAAKQAGPQAPKPKREVSKRMMALLREISPHDR